MERTAFTAYRDKVVTNCARVIVGKDDIIEKVLVDRKSTRLNSSHMPKSRMPSSA